MVWHEAPFAVGANLQQVGEGLCRRPVRHPGSDGREVPARFATLKYAQVPVVAAVQGMALGGGCRKFVMHAGKRVMALESYVGLVEAGVGLIPAGGGCKGVRRACAEWAAQSATPGEVFNFLQPVFQTIAMAKVAKSAVEAIDMGFAKPSDTILFNANELLCRSPSRKRGPWPTPAMPRRRWRAA